jgi:hypothetical protein
MPKVVLERAGVLSIIRQLEAAGVAELFPCTLMLTWRGLGISHLFAEMLVLSPSRHANG